MKLKFFLRYCEQVVLTLTEEFAFNLDNFFFCAGES